MAHLCRTNHRPRRGGLGSRRGSGRGVGAHRGSPRCRRSRGRPRVHIGDRGESRRLGSRLCERCGLRRGLRRDFGAHGRDDRRRRNGLRRRLRLCGRSRDGTRRQEREGVDVALLLARDAQPEVHERRVEVDDSTRPDGSDDSTFADPGAAYDLDRAQVHERRRVAGRRLDRDRLAAGRHGACEAHDPVGGRAHVRAGGSTEIQAAMLAGRVRMRAVERERPEHRAVDRPGPRLRRRHRQYERAKGEQNESPQHEEASLLPDLRTQRRYQDRPVVVNTGYKVRR
jgi:hypothetical protein